MSTKSKSSTLRRLGSSEAWGWPLFWFAAILYAWGSFWSDAVLSGNYSPYWILIYLTTFVAAVGLALIFKALFLDRLLKKHPSGVLNLIVAGSIGAAKNLLVGFLSSELGLIEDALWAYRPIAGFIAGVIVFLFYSVSFGAQLEHRIIINELNRVQNWLIGLRKDSAEKLAEAHELLATQTRQTLLPKLQSIKLLLDATGAGSNTIEQLRKVINKDVRPLSEELNERAIALQQTPQSQPVRLRKVKFFQGHVSLRGLIKLGPIAIILPIGNLFAGYLLLSAPECLDVFYFTWVGVIFLTLVKLLIPRHLRVSRGAAATILILLAAVAGLPAVLAGWYHTNDPILMLLISSLILSSVFLVLGFAWPASLDEDRIEARNRLERVNQDLKHELSLFDQQLWLARRHWQFIVHGTVQSALTAALTRLQSSDSDETTLELVTQDLNRAERALMNPPEHVIDLPESLAELQSVWRGIVTIKINITERATKALMGNNAACVCVNEIIKEAVSNAVRHGQAKTITIEVDREGQQALHIKVSNDGLPIKQRPKAGVGSRLIKELTTSW
ncbi:MAG: hypothetical protein RLZZ594_791, partial [Actinomycetota bacterium]